MTWVSFGRRPAAFGGGIPRFDGRCRSREAERAPRCCIIFAGPPVGGICDRVTRLRGYEFPDGGAWSIDGRLHFEVHTHAVPRRLLSGGRMRRWRLVDVAVTGLYRDDVADREIWARTDPATHPWPLGLYVHVDGTTAALHADDTLHLHDPDGGEVGAVDVLAALREDPRARRRLGSSTAGSGWGTYPRGCFVQLRGRLCLSLRSFWGARVIVDARTGARVSEAPWMAEDLRAAEAAWALACLLRAVREGREVPFWTKFAGQDVRDVIAAAQLAGQLGVTAAAALLQGLRLADPAGVLPAVPEDRSGRTPGELDVRDYATSWGRRAIQLALLRLGHDPGPRPAYLFMAGDAWRGRPYDPGPRPTTWASELSGVRRGLSARALLARAGAPFHVAGETWDYDVVAGGPRTIRVTLGRRGVKDVRVVAPPEWISGHARDGLM